MRCRLAGRHALRLYTRLTSEALARMGKVLAGGRVGGWGDGTMCACVWSGGSIFEASDMCWREVLIFCFFGRTQPHAMSQSNINRQQQRHFSLYNRDTSLPLRPRFSSLIKSHREMIQAIHSVPYFPYSHAPRPQSRQSHLFSSVNLSTISHLTNAVSGRSHIPQRGKLTTQTDSVLI
jgi:hypothetical protein